MRVANSDQQLHRLLRLSTPGEIVPNQRLVIQDVVHQHEQTAGRVPTRTLVRLRKSWAEDARAYNEVVTSWSGIESAAVKDSGYVQRELFDN